MKLLALHRPRRLAAGAATLALLVLPPAGVQAAGTAAPTATTTPSPATTPSGPAAAGGVAAPGTPPSTSTPGAPATTTPTTQTTPTVATTPTISTAVPLTTPANSPRPSTAKQGSGRLSDGALAAAVLAGLIALACIVWGIFRLGAFEPHWLLSLRHALAEAGFRASATWAEFTDWLRLGH